MLYHHDSRPYEVSAQEAAAVARAKLEKLIEDGRSSAMATIEAIQRDIPTDTIAAGGALHFFDTEDSGNPVGMIIDGRILSLHRRAFGQVIDKSNITRTYAKRLVEGGTEWERELLIYNLREQYSRSDKRFLVRDVRDEVRGFVSDKFKRLDSRPIIEAFAEACANIGAVPVEGRYMDTNVSIKAMLPTIFEPVPNEVIGIGLCLRNSDYGHGKLMLSMFLNRLWCTNQAIAEDLLDRRHLGGRLADDITYSEQTYQLDTATMVSQVRDLVNIHLSPDKTTALCEAVKAASEDEVSPGDIKAFLKRIGNKDLQSEIVTAFNSPDVVNLPPGQNKLRLSNAISWIAGKQDDGMDALRLQDIAGQLLVA